MASPQTTTTQASVKTINPPQQQTEKEDKVKAEPFKEILSKSQKRRIKKFNAKKIEKEQAAAKPVVVATAPITPTPPSNSKAKNGQ